MTSGPKGDGHMHELTAQQVVERLQLTPHPEGGWFRETWRHDPGDGSRGAGTAIYFLLSAGQRSHWHRVDADEIWHWYAGAPLHLHIWNEGDTAIDHRLVGPALQGDQLPQARVPPSAWQAAESSGAWTLVGCTVSPAFVFDRFELAPEDWEPPVH